MKSIESWCGLASTDNERTSGESFNNSSELSEENSNKISVHFSMEIMEKHKTLD